VHTSAAGDFAVLLKAGMSAKQAVFYNLLSSILCLFGMVLGVFLGESETATVWVFAAAAGMFLYIALVDMVRDIGYLIVFLA
jgi:zinc transporter 10